MEPPKIKKGDRVVWRGHRGVRYGVVKDIDTSAQSTADGRALGWPYAAWVLFDDAKSQESWLCVNAYELKEAPRD